MQLFKARKAAEREVEEALAEAGVRIDEARDFIARRQPGLAHAFHRSPHRAGCTAADLIHEVGVRRAPLKTAARTLLAMWRSRFGDGRNGDAHGNGHGDGNGNGNGRRLGDIARAAAQKAAVAPRPVPTPATVDERREDGPKLPAGFRTLPMAAR
jgi:hypothetical protein